MLFQFQFTLKTYLIATYNHSDLMTMMSEKTAKILLKTCVPTNL